MEFMGLANLRFVVSGEREVVLMRIIDVIALAQEHATAQGLPPLELTKDFKVSDLIQQILIVKMDA